MYTIKEMNAYLKEVLERNFEMPEITVKIERLEITFEGKVMWIGFYDFTENDYILYDFSLWFYTPGRGKELPLNETFKQEDRIVEFFDKLAFKEQIKRKDNAIVEEIKVEEPKKEEKVITNLFDLLEE